MTDHAMEIAVWRFDRIQSLLRARLTPAGRHRKIEAIANSPVAWPSGRFTPVPSRTVYRWLATYRKSGKLESLCPVQRTIEKLRTVRPEWARYALDAFLRDPSCSLRSLSSQVKRHFHLRQPPNVATLQRSLSREPRYRFLREHSHGGLSEADARTWMRGLLQGKFPLETVRSEMRQVIPEAQSSMLYDAVLEGTLRKRSLAVALLARFRGIGGRVISDFLGMTRTTMARHVRRFSDRGAASLLTWTRPTASKAEDVRYKDALFSILHAPPSDFNINRTTWRLDDLHAVMRSKGFPIGKQGIADIVAAAGYHFRKAKRVLTSTDPLYREKLERVTSILSALKPTEKFFSIDEFGPFAVKKQGGRSLVKSGETRTYPQFQKSKGSLIVTGALELSTNQVTHFYSDHKNTAEMIRLLDVLLKKYAREDRIFFSWDAASWHASEALYKRVDELNRELSQAQRSRPEVVLVPLPSCAQFLNVIESVFSGMARAIIHNSDYQCVAECKAAIDRYFRERNDHFRRNPKRAGKKIWGQERVPPVFSESNNCKDPQFAQSRAWKPAPRSRRRAQCMTRDSTTSRKPTNQAVVGTSLRAAPHR